MFKITYADMQDTFYIITEEILLRPISPVQARAMDAWLTSNWRWSSPSGVFRRIRWCDPQATNSIKSKAWSLGISWPTFKGTLQLIVQDVWQNVKLFASFLLPIHWAIWGWCLCFKCGGVDVLWLVRNWLDWNHGELVWFTHGPESGIDPTIYSGFAFGLWSRAWPCLLRNQWYPWLLSRRCLLSEQFK